MDCLYLSHTGMTEPLGRAQVLPYLFGLAKLGHEIEILSHEPVGTPPDVVEATRATIEGFGIRWRPLVRSASHHLAVKVWESSRAALIGLAAALRRRPRIVHARSYLPAAVADVIATITPGAKMLFDCRGMLGDEYVDGGNWAEDRLEYRLLKRFEKHAFHRTEGLVVLTEALKRWMRETQAVPTRTDITVVPCCVEAERFRGDEASRRAARLELGVANDRLVVVYSGSLGSWYQEEEMARFVGSLQRSSPDLTWMVFTRADSTGLRAAAAREGVRDVVVRAASPEEMPRLLAAGDLGLSFIRPCFSKTGSSPTKVAEYLASGMPVVVNAGIGDQGDLALDSEACIVLGSYDDAELDRGAKAALALAMVPHATRSGASRRVVDARFSLTKLGVPRYDALYRRLIAS